VVVALGLAASLLARGISPALRGVAGDRAIAIMTWVASFGTLLAATGLVAGIARLASSIAATPRAPLVARVVAVPSVAFGCLLLLLASFRPLQPMLALLLGLSAGVVGLLSARHSVGMRDRRAGALVLGLMATAGLVHLLSRKLTLDASATANLAAFRAAQLSETLAALLDAAAIALALLWLQRRSPRGRLLVPLVLAGAAIWGVIALRAAEPSSSQLTALLARALDRGTEAGASPFSRGVHSLIPAGLRQALDASALFAAVAALLSGSEIGIVMAACLAARAALDVPIPALMLELGALYLPFARASNTPAKADAPKSAPLPEAPPEMR
jgi:hypothetical protein